MAPPPILPSYRRSEMNQDITLSDLRIMQHAVQYREWLLSQVQPFVGKRILEVGAGIGNYTEFLVDRELVVCLEIHDEAVRSLRERFATYPNIIVRHGDIADESVTELAASRFDTVLCFNVLEHVRDDLRALQHAYHVLVTGGTLLLIVPAVPAVMGTVDRSLGHYRRYRPRTLAAVVGDAGFSIHDMRFMNSLGLLGWLWNNRIARRREESAAQITFYSRLIVPWLSLLERLVRPPIGLSLVCIAHRR